MSERAEMEAAIEAVLFVSSDPVPRSRLLELFDEREREAAAEALESVLARWAPAAGRGVQADEVAGGVRLVTRPDLHGWLRRFFAAAGASKLSMAALETLAIIAYHQPVTAPEIQELRSVNPAGVLKTLLERRLVRIAGRKEVVGKPFLYCTSREFLVHFGLKSLKDLPPLEEFEEALALETGGSGESSDEAASGEGSAAAGGGRQGATAPGQGVAPLQDRDEADREEAILREAALIEDAVEADGGEPAAAVGVAVEER